MFEYYGGVSHVTVPDCLKTGVVKCHLYDPDLNEDYAYLAAHFSTAIVPARVRKPRDKAICEGLVKILCRYFRFRFRRSRFTSIAEINRALDGVRRAHQRPDPPPLWRLAPRTVREDRESRAQGLAERGVRRRRVEDGEAAPRLLRRRGRRLLQRTAYPPPQKATNQAHRAPCRDLPQSRALGDPSAVPAENGQRIKILEHFPANSIAFYEATPQKLLSQSRFIHPDLNTLFLELFNADVYAHIRRAMGLVSACTKEISRSGHALASEHIGTAIATMRRYNRIRTPYFQELLKQARKQSMNPQPTRDIVRRPGNPFLRYVGGAALQATDEPSIPPTAAQENLPL